MKVVRRPTEAELAARLAAVPAEFSYRPVGATRTGALPAGWRHVDRSWVLPPGCYEAAVRSVLSLEVQRRAGLLVAAGPLEPGSPVLQAFPVGPVALLVPCRVAYVVREADLAGFAYGTVAGHPERGEEAFLIRRSGRAVTVTIRSYTRPGSPLVGALWPATGALVRLMVGRYGAAVRAAC